MKWSVAMGGLVNRPYPPMSEGSQSWVVVVVWGLGGVGAWCGAQIGTLECSLWLCRDCPAGQRLSCSGAYYDKQPRSSRHPEATGLVAETRKGGGLPRLPLIRGTCRQSAPPSLLPSVKPPPLPTRTHSLSCRCNYCNCFT